MESAKKTPRNASIEKLWMVVDNAYLCYQLWYSLWLAAAVCMSISVYSFSKKYDPLNC